MTFRDPLRDDIWRLISQHQTPSDDGAVRSIIPPIGTIGRISLAVEATKVFHPGDLNDRVGPSSADVEYRRDVAILSNDVVVARAKSNTSVTAGSGEMVHGGVVPHLGCCLLRSPDGTRTYP